MGFRGDMILNADIGTHPLPEWYVAKWLREDGLHHLTKFDGSPSFPIASVCEQESGLWHDLLNDTCHLLNELPADRPNNPYSATMLVWWECDGLDRVTVWQGIPAVTEDIEYDDWEYDTSKAQWHRVSHWERAPHWREGFTHGGHCDNHFRLYSPCGMGEHAWGDWSKPQRTGQEVHVDRESEEGYDLVTEIAHSYEQVRQCKGCGKKETHSYKTRTHEVIAREPTFREYN